MKLYLPHCLWCTQYFLFYLEFLLVYFNAGPNSNIKFIHNSLIVMDHVLQFEKHWFRGLFTFEEESEAGVQDKNFYMKIHQDVSSNCLNDGHVKWVFSSSFLLSCIFQGYYNNMRKEICFHKGEIMTIWIIYKIVKLVMIFFLSFL